MWFKNLQVYRLPCPWQMDAQQLESELARHIFRPCANLDMQSQGWLSPRDNGQLVHGINKQMLLLFGVEKKLLPTAVINQVTKIKLAELQEQQGFAPGRRQKKEMKESVTDELLPRAFCILRTTQVWIDPVHGWLVIDAASPSRADDVLKLLFQSIPSLPLVPLHVAHPPAATMTGWLLADEAPGGFSVDQDTELCANNEGKATVRYVRHTLDPEDVRRHVKAGKQCTRLALTWDGRISFVLTENLIIKRVTPLDVLKEEADTTANDEERLDADFMLMTGELGKLLDDLVLSLGGHAAQNA